MTQGSIPSLYEWAGGAPEFVRLTEIFYRRVEGEPLLAGLFAQAEPGHATYVAQFIGEVCGRPKRYSVDRWRPREHDRASPREASDRGAACAAGRH